MLINLNKNLPRIIRFEYLKAVSAGYISGAAIVTLPVVVTAAVAKEPFAGAVGLGAGFFVVGSMLCANRSLNRKIAALRNEAPPGVRTEFNLPEP
jgi:hypothetical protein